MVAALCRTRFFSFFFCAHFRVWPRTGSLSDMMLVDSDLGVKSMDRVHVWIWELVHKEGWGPKNWCFRFCSWRRRLLRDPWRVKTSNQSILMKINPEYSLEGLILKLKLQYFGHLIRRSDSFEKTQMLGKIVGKRRRGWQRMRRLAYGIIDSMDMNLSKLWETVKDREAWHAAFHGISKIQTWLSDWTTATTKGSDNNWPYKMLITRNLISHLITFQTAHVDVWEEGMGNSGTQLTNRSCLFRVTLRSNMELISAKHTLLSLDFRVGADQSGAAKYLFSQETHH